MDTANIKVDVNDIDVANKGRLSLNYPYLQWYDFDILIIERVKR